jgi:hypothetical protein
MSHENRTVKVIDKAGPSGFIFFLAYIGAAIYFVEKAGNGFWDVVLALLQAAVWPVYVMYNILQSFGV